MPNRRRLLLAGISALAAPGPAQEAGPPHVMTVTGPMPPAGLGLTLVHEHVMVDFIGADRVSRDRYEADEVVNVALPHLQKARELGCRTLVECTPAYLGRDPLLLKRLSEASRLRILTNTGYYGAAGGKFLPRHARTETAEQLAQRWVREARDGIDGTGIRPGILKIGVDGAPLPEINRKLVEAAALTHRATGLTIHQHTGSGAAALEALDLLRSHGVAGEAFVWVHAQSEHDATQHREATRRGAWVEFDGIAPDTVERHVELVRGMKNAGLLGRVLVSHDAGWYHVGEPNGGTFRPFDTLFTRFLPALREAGFTPEEVRQLLVSNPRAALAPRIRRARER